MGGYNNVDIEIGWKGAGQKMREGGGGAAEKRETENLMGFL